MQFPDFEYGIYKDVLAACRKRVTALARGDSWDAVTAGARIDSADHPGLIVLHGPSPLLGGAPHFHAFALHMAIQDALAKGRLTQAVVDAVWAQSLEAPWSLVGLLAQTNLVWAYPEHRRQALLDACLRHWDALVAEGPRYSAGSNVGAPFWSLHSNLKMVLSNLGVATAALNAPLPPGGVPALLAHLP
ncbi:hypothetical protein [Massilia sp. CF038]|uniref:hypothetical protein n=1 Tax=Massilia sp. CF038 TaxID=1881045 RepID=UPI00091C7B95|nr:hypothetical protein [Massilia sp. CF038]SHH71301.1 hypothetical protein SAMN05428948_5054 [Massilia sp. CF038]